MIYCHRNKPGSCDIKVNNVLFRIVLIQNYRAQKLVEVLKISELLFLYKEPK